jgi:hypothetical protein
LLFYSFCLDYNVIMNQLDRLERLVQQLIEGSFQCLFRKRLHPVDLADHLAVAVEAGCQNGRGVVLIPNYYQILLNPADYAVLVEKSSRNTVVTELYDYLTNLAAEANYQFDGPLQVLLDQDERVLPGRVQVKTNVAKLLKMGD